MPSGLADQLCTGGASRFPRQCAQRVRHAVATHWLVERQGVNVNSDAVDLISFSCSSSLSFSSLFFCATPSGRRGTLVLSLGLSGLCCLALTTIHGPSAVASECYHRTCWVLPLLNFPTLLHCADGGVFGQAGGDGIVCCLRRAACGTVSAGNPQRCAGALWAVDLGRTYFLTSAGSQNSRASARCAAVWAA